MIFLDFLNRKTLRTVLLFYKKKMFKFPTITFCNLQICGFSDYDFAKYLQTYKTEETNKFGSSQEEIIMKKLREDYTKTSYFLAKVVEF